MVGWHHWCNRCEFEQTPGDGEAQGRLVCCSPWGHGESTRLNNSCFSFRSTGPWTSFAHTYVHSVFKVLSHIGHDRVLSRVPELYSRSLLVTYFEYSRVYISIPTSQFIPPSHRLSLFKKPFIDFSFFFGCMTWHAAWEILVPRSGIKPMLPAVKQGDHKGSPPRSDS